MLYLKQCENNECLIGKVNSAILKKQRNVTFIRLIAVSWLATSVFKQPIAIINKYIVMRKH